jgi:hypothetical protein
MLMMWCMAWMTAMIDPMGLNAMRMDSSTKMERGPANAAVDTLRSRLS